jgi:hypothetical protein
MTRAASALLVVALAACASEDQSGGTNPPTLWLGMSQADTQMRLVAEEPTPY